MTLNPYKAVLREINREIEHGDVDDLVRPIVLALFGTALIAVTFGAFVALIAWQPLLFVPLAILAAWRLWRWICRG